MIQIENLIKEFDDEKVLNDISFNVKKGEVFGFLGPNGAGKTTTIKILTTLLRPTDGIVTVAGYDVEENPLSVRMSFGYVGQQSGVDPAFTIKENLRLQGRLYHLSKETIDRRIKELLALFDMEGREDQWVGSLSGGWKRRVDIATALIHEPKLLFLDEPTIGLDPKSRSDLWSYLRKLNKEQGMTLFLTTHHLDEVDQLADRVAILEAGRIRTIGTPDDLKDSLGADVIQLTFSKPIVSAMLTVFKKKEWFKDVIQQGNEVRFYLGNGQQMLPKVIQWIDGLALTAISVSLARPTFDDVFLKYTGKNWLTADDATDDEWGSWGGGKNNKWAKKWQDKGDAGEEGGDKQVDGTDDSEPGGEADWKKWGGQASADWNPEESANETPDPSPKETADSEVQEKQSSDWNTQKSGSSSQSDPAEASSSQNRELDPPTSSSSPETKTTTSWRSETPSKTSTDKSDSGGEEDWKKWGGGQNWSEKSEPSSSESTEEQPKKKDASQESWPKEWSQGEQNWPKDEKTKDD